MSPPIVSRADWGANPANTPAGTIATPTPDLWLHHTGSTGLHGASGMRSLQAGAIAGGYVDLEYTYCVDDDGTIFMSRGPGRNTAATGSNNETSHAICAMNNYEVTQPSDRLLSAIASLVTDLYANRWTQRNAITGPHRDAPGNATACCGRNLIARIGDINAMAASGSGSGPAPAPPSTKGGAVGITGTPSGKGYWIVADNGAVYAYGDAKYYGGANTQKLNAPIVGIDAAPDGKGYWLLAQDGGVFAYGSAPFQGSAAGHI